MVGVKGVRPVGVWGAPPEVPLQLFAARVRRAHRRVHGAQYLEDLWPRETLQVWPQNVEARQELAEVR